MNALSATSHLGAAAVIDEDVYGRNSDVCYEDDLQESASPMMRTVLVRSILPMEQHLDHQSGINCNRECLETNKKRVVVPPRMVWIASWT